ncbi:MAG TPA: AlkA N-terminal domain-containing protein [Streptosporangiaceae bacterium]|nr:AlkA N-terminal domain-containing protein [Streptosporangiaceae bacterium]
MGAEDVGAENITLHGAGNAGEAGQAARLLIQPSAPFRLDYVVWALRRRAHNEVDRFDGDCYRRVLCLAGEPAEVTVRQDPTASTPSLVADLRGPAEPARHATTAACQVLERMLGLGADLDGFYRVATGDARLNALAARFRGMRPPCFPTVFEAVVNAVACQQLSLDVGIHLLNRLARRFGPAIAGPVIRYGFPAPDRLADAEPAELRALGFSTAKARTIIAVARQVAAGALDLEALRDASDDRAMGILLGLPGIGRWSAEYVMLRGLSRYHVLPGDDVGARNNLRRRFGLAEDAGYDAVASLSRRWQPYAGLVYFHLLLDSLAARGDLEEAG